MCVCCPYRAAVGVLVMACRAQCLCIHVQVSKVTADSIDNPHPASPGLSSVPIVHAGGFTFCMQIELVVRRRTLCGSDYRVH